MDPVPTDNTDLLTAMMAGATAGAVQSIATYPFEYMKTSTQIQNAALTAKPPITPYTIRPLYTGCSALAVGNALKAATRMSLFTSFSDFMKTDNGTTTAPRIVVAGLMTGFVETLWVIPFENIKTRMIENELYKEGLRLKVEEELGGVTKKKPTMNQRPQQASSHISPSRLKALQYYRQHPSTTFPTILKEIYRTQGLRGFKRGSLMTVMRQVMNSMVWYSTYGFLQQLIDPNRDSLTELELLGMGFASSCAVVATTQPMDLLKTRMQTKDYRFLYRDVMTTVYKTFMEEGLKKFWCGWFPRLIKVSCSSSVTLVTYEWTVKGIEKMRSMKPFEAE